MQILDEGNFTLYAARHYDNPNCTDVLEFQDDLNRIKYIKRLFKRYVETGELRERLLLNHFIVLNNMFGADAAITLLLFKIEKEHWPLLKSFLVYLNMLKENELLDVETNEEILKVLKAL